MTTGFLPETAPGSVDLRVALNEAQAALRAGREREAVLRRELDHRVKNMLAITRSVFARTMENACSLDHARDHFNGRLDVLSRYHGRLAAMPDGGFDLETMIWDELMVFSSAGDGRIVVQGPAVHFTHLIAQAIGLALHELATNSVKFGVLSEPAGSGRLRITWDEQDGRVRFSWAETGVPIIASAPIEAGFGREFIEQALPYQLGAETEFRLVPGGLICGIEFTPNGPHKLEPHPVSAVNR